MTPGILAVKIKFFDEWVIFKSTEDGKSLGFGNYFVISPGGYFRYDFTNLRKAEKFAREKSQETAHA